MLKKLIKYDFKKMFQVLPYFYIATVFFAILTRVVNIWKDIQFIFILGQIFQGTAIALMVNCLVNTILGILIRSFRNSFYSDEGYLTHTLPVTKSKLLLSKFISAILVLLITVTVSLASLMIMFYSKEFVELFKQTLNIVETGLNINATLLLFLLALVIFFQLSAMLLMGFASIVKGHSYNNKKILKTFIWFAIYYAFASVISLVIVALVLLITGNIAELLASVMQAKTFIIIIVTGLVIYIGYTALFYYIANKLFNKGVNLD